MNFQRINDEQAEQYFSEQAILTCSCDLPQFANLDWRPVDEERRRQVLQQASEDQQPEARLHRETNS